MLAPQHSARKRIAGTRRSSAAIHPEQMSRAPNPEPALQELEQKLNHAFTHPALLEEALTHGSLRHEQILAAGDGHSPEAADNERLEFLGDAIVGLLVAESLFRRFLRASEGELTRLRAALVSRKHLGEVGQALDLGRWLRLGRSEERSGARTRPVLLANCVEALTAALYLDAGIEAARSFVERVIVEPEAARLHRELKARHAIGDYKSALQELLQSRGSAQPEYFVEAELGPDHRKRFIVELRAAAAASEPVRALAKGAGSTKKKAEQEAAKRALARLNAPVLDPMQPASGKGALASETSNGKLRQKAASATREPSA